MLDPVAYEVLEAAGVQVIQEGDLEVFCTDEIGLDIEQVFMRFLFVQRVAESMVRGRLSPRAFLKLLEPTVDALAEMVRQQMEKEGLTDGN
jgi:hypothetical protein